VSDAPLPEVLAGPFLRYTTPTEAYVWLATSIPLKQHDILVEFWDPAPHKYLPIQDKPSYSLAGGAATVWPSSDVRSLQVTPCLYANLVRTRFNRRLRPNKVYAYRVVLHPLRERLDEPEPHAEDPPGGALERLAPLGPTEPKPSFASFVLGQPTNFWIWGLPSQAVAPLTAAGKELHRRVQHDPGERPAAARVPKPAPNAAFFFGNPWTFGPDLPEVAFNAILGLAGALAGPSPLPFDWYKAVYAAAYLLAWSPNLWSWSTELQPWLRALAGLTDAVNATACIMANTPSYVLGTTPSEGRALTERATAGTGGLAGLASASVNAVFADWPNAPDSLTFFELLTLARAVGTSDASLARSAVLPQQPAIGCAAAGDSIATVLDPEKAIRDRIPTAVSVDPVLRQTDGATREPPAAVKQHDVTLVVSFTGGRAFIAESGLPLDAQPAATFATSGDGSLHGKVLEVAASPGGAPDSRRRRPEVEVNVRREVPDARYASLRRTGGSVTMSLEPTTPDADTVTVLLPAHGRIVPLDSGPDKLHLGNRFRRPSARARLEEGQGDDGHLKDVEVALYDERGTTPLRKAKASATGQVNLDLSGLDGRYKLRTQGDLTFSHAGPDTPAPVGHTGHFRPRVWKAHEFDVEITDGAWLSIDHEPVPSGPFRLLIDPVWMQADQSHRSGPRDPRVKPTASCTNPAGSTVRFVDLLILHSTGEPNDATHFAEGWLRPSDDPTRNVSANYLVARDGTVIKCVDESRAANHAGPRNQWRNKSSGNPPDHSSGHLPALNQFAIGIELVKSFDSMLPFTERQYEALLGNKSAGTLGLLDLLLGRGPGKAAISARCGGSPSDPDYIDIDIGDTEVIGHGDCRLVNFTGGGGIDVLGGKPDPTLAFEWARLEAAEIGLRRKAPPVPLQGHQPTGPTHREHGKPGQRWHAIAGWVQQQQADETSGYADVCNDVNGGILVPPSHTIIKQRVFDDLTKLGYWAGNTLEDGETRRYKPNGHDEGTPFQKAITAFRTHFFSGARRTLAFTDPHNPESGNEEADYDLDKVTVVWIYKVARDVDQLRNPSTP
jgi:N-acetyl-anhydromuramyl-L-alanine amidase AmpD